MHFLERYSSWEAKLVASSVSVSQLMPIQADRSQLARVIRGDRIYALVETRIDVHDACAINDIKGILARP